MKVSSMKWSIALEHLLIKTLSIYATIREQSLEWENHGNYNIVRTHETRIGGNWSGMISTTLMISSDSVWSVDGMKMGGYTGFQATNTALIALMHQQSWSAFPKSIVNGVVSNLYSCKYAVVI